MHIGSIYCGNAFSFVVFAANGFADSVAYLFRFLYSLPDFATLLAVSGIISARQYGPLVFLVVRPKSIDFNINVLCFIFNYK